ncbi:MAG: acylphosphatase [Candidatus Latescibacteria bacterium]|nr:acylphosphatase [Candidatus Latescibacterota bacterium]
MTPRSHERFSAHVMGRVQGVGFRAFVYDAAHKLGIAGSVRNLRSGGVLVEAEGPRERLERLLHRLEAGPPAAKVEQVSVKWTEPEGLTRFTILPT